MDNAFRVRALRAPPAPRDVHSASRLNVATAGQLLRLFGILWTSLGVALALVFTVLARTAAPQLLLGVSMSGAAVLGGSLVWLLGIAARRRAHALLRDGAEAEGQVTRVGVYPYARMNGRNPWRVEYTFVDATGAIVAGETRSWNPSRPVVSEGDPITVIYDPRRPARSVPWTPMHAEAGGPGALGERASRKVVRVDPAAASAAVRAEVAADPAGAPGSAEAVQTASEPGAQPARRG